jgi:hypothetical protein
MKRGTAKATDLATFQYAWSLLPLEKLGGKAALSELLITWQQASLRTMHHFYHKELANIMYASSKLQLHDLRADFVAAWQDASEQQMRRMMPNELTQLIVGAGKLKLPISKLLWAEWQHAVLQQFGRSGMQHATVQQASNCIWACALLDSLKPLPDVVAVLWDVAVRDAGNSIMQNAATLIWGSATLGWHPSPLCYEAWQSMVLQHADTANGQDLANVLWALGKLEIPLDPLLWRVLKARLLQIVSELEPQAVGNFIWGCTTLSNNSYRFRVPHQVCLPGSRSKTVRAMRCETCINRPRSGGGSLGG